MFTVVIVRLVNLLQVGSRISGNIRFTFRRLMHPQLIVAVVVEAFHCDILDRAIRPPDLTVDPPIVVLCTTVLEAVHLTDHAEAHQPVQRT